MLVTLGILSLRHNDTTHLLPMKHLTDTSLTLILFITERHHDIIATGHRSFLDTCQDGGEIIVRELRHDNTNDL